MSRKSGSGNWAIVASIIAPISPAAGSTRFSASRTDPLARAAAALSSVRAIALQGSPSPTTMRAISAGRRRSRFSRRQRDRIVGSTWPGSMRDDQEQRARRRLLDHFQQSVGAGAIEVLGAVDDADAPAAGARRFLEKLQARCAHPRRGFPNRNSSIADSSSGAALQDRDGPAPAPAARRAPSRSTPRSRSIPNAAALGSGCARMKRAKRQASVALPTPSGPPISQAWASFSER